MSGMNDLSQRNPRDYPHERVDLYQGFVCPPDYHTLQLALTSTVRMIINCVYFKTNLLLSIRMKGFPLMKHFPFATIALPTAVLAIAMLVGSSAHAEDYILSLKGDTFTPKEITIPADQKVKLTVKNLNAKPAEFESHDLNREKIIPANGEIVVFVGPLKPGSYTFFDEFQEETAKGTIVVK